MQKKQALCTGMWRVWIVLLRLVPAQPLQKAGLLWPRLREGNQQQEGVLRLRLGLAFQLLLRPVLNRLVPSLL